MTLMFFFKFSLPTTLHKALSFMFIHPRQQRLAKSEKEWKGRVENSLIFYASLACRVLLESLAHSLFYMYVLQFFPPLPSTKPVEGNARNFLIKKGLLNHFDARVVCRSYATLNVGGKDEEASRNIPNLIFPAPLGSLFLISKRH